MIDWLRDKTRDNLARDLNSLGITTILMERGRWEEKIEKTRHQRSLGIIDIPGGVVRWVNILRRDGGENRSPQWWIVFCIPDERRNPEQQPVNIRTIRKKTFPLFGRVVDITWTGRDSATGLIDILSNDEAIQNLAKNIGNLTIHSYAREFQGWTLQIDRRFKPTDRDWSAIQKIAKYLLSSIHFL
jgi:hypothetical protein